jgi:hypothetical protein
MRHAGVAGLLRRHKCEICYPPPPIDTDVSVLVPEL